MYTVTERQNVAGSFLTLDTVETYTEAIDSAKTHVDGMPDGYTVYVFNEQTYQGKVYPYLVARVSFLNNRYTVGGTLVQKY